jgi:cell division initiation protein
MTYAPVELRHVKLERGVLGYRRGPVDGLLAEVADSYEGVWRERAELADRVDGLEGELTRYRELEGLLRTTLVSAERAALELREQAQREANTILEEAHSEARAITREARATREALALEARRIRTLLRAALDALEESGDTFENRVPAPPTSDAEAA